MMPKRLAAFIIAAALLAGSLMFLNAGAAFSGYGNATSGEWFNTSWHFRSMISINSTVVNRTNWPVEMQINFSDMLPEGNFDNNSIRVIEYNSTGSILGEIPSQFDPGDGYSTFNAVGELVFIMNGTTPTNATRIFYLYFDNDMHGTKEAPTYPTNLSKSWDGQYANVNNARLEIWIDTNRSENTSGIFYVRETKAFVPIIDTQPDQRTAEYTELFNGSGNVTYNLIGNLTFVEGPVRLTVVQQGPEMPFGDPANPTGEARIVKKYYFYSNAGPQEYGSYIKVSQEFFSNNSDITRSNLFAGALALDLDRTMTFETIQFSDFNSQDPYSWAWARNTIGPVVGIVNLNETVPGFFAANDTAMGRLGISLDSTSIASGNSIRDTALLFFSTGVTAGVSEFLSVRDSATNPPMITMNKTEKWNVIIEPLISASVFNRNESFLIRGNAFLGDPYGLTHAMNATLDRGTPSLADDINITLFDDGTHGDETASDRIFTNTFDVPLDAEVGVWTINFTSYGNSGEYLNSSTYAFNVTDIYFVNITIANPVGIITRNVTANITVMNFNRTLPVTGALINCLNNGQPVGNKTEIGGGLYSVNFSASPAVGNFSLECNATLYNNTGNSSGYYQTEPLKTFVSVNATPQAVNVTGITLFDNQSFILEVNVTDIGQGPARFANISFALITGWSVNSSVQLCGNLSVNSSCVRSFNITVPQNTTPGQYVINATAAWINPDLTAGSNKTSINVTVLSNPVVNVSELNISGIASDGVQKNITSFMVQSIGNDALTGINFTCQSGIACTDFNITFLPSNYSSLNVGANLTVTVYANVSLGYAPGLYSGTVNVSSGNVSDLVNVSIELQNTTAVMINSQPSVVSVNNITLLNSSGFSFNITVTNLGNSSARNATADFFLPNGFFINSSEEQCGNITSFSTCLIANNVTVENTTTAGSYAVNVTVNWVDLNGSQSSYQYSLNVTVAANPVITLENFSLSGTVMASLNQNPFNLTVQSIGNANLSAVSVNCISGVVCSNFSINYTPSTLSGIIPGQSKNISVNVTVPTGFQAGTYNGTLNISSNGGYVYAFVQVTVPATRTWTMSPVSCQRSEYPDAGTVCSVNVSNTGNDFINFTIVNISVNMTYPNETNFTMAKGTNHSFSVLYNITGFPQLIYYESYNVTPIQDSITGNITLNITLLPYLPPSIKLEVSPGFAEQNQTITIYANVTDLTMTGISFVNISVMQPNGTLENASMQMISQLGNFSRWRFTYPNSTISFGRTNSRGLYNLTVTAGDNIGNVGNESSNFTIYLKLVVSARTLASRYYQGDTGTIYYSARDIDNLGVADVNVSFRVLNPNSTAIFSANKLTDSYGTFEPLPLFSLSSDAVTGNYTLYANSTYNDSVAGVIVSNVTTYTFTTSEKTVTVTGLFADIETAVVWFPNNVMRFNILSYNGEGQPVDPTSLNLTVYDPAQNIYFSTNMTNMTRRGLGFYSYSYAMGVGSATGMYLAVVNISRNALESMRLNAFRVAAGGPYDVRLALANNEVEQGNPLDYTIVIENKGEVTQDVYVNYTIVGVADGITYYSATEAVLTPAFANQSFSRSASIFSNQPLGTYTLNARVKYDNVQPEINVSTTFQVIATRRQPPVPPSPPTPSPSPVNVTVITKPANISSILIEKYSSSVSVYPGFEKIEYVVVRNSGVKTLYDVSINILGIPVSWFNITPQFYGELGAANSTVFLVDYHIPSDAVVGNYSASIIVTSDSANDQKSLTVNILKSMTDLIQCEINSLKDDLKNLYVDIGSAKNEGKSVSDVLLMAEQIDMDIQKAEFNFNLNNTETSLLHIQDAKTMLDQARSLLSKLKKPEVEVKAEFPWLVIFALLIVLVLLIIMFILRKKKKLPNSHLAQRMRHIASALEKLRGAGESSAELLKERENFKRMLSVLDREKAEGIVSQAAYGEMKKSMESRLSKIEGKIEKSMRVAR